MGAGKTTVGRLLALRAGWDFLDMDERIEERLGETVAQVFATRGEAAFRAEEEAVARELAERERLVVAAGGGAFVSPSTRKLLKHKALTVWLRCSLETILRRVPADGRRPLAGNRDIMQARLDERVESYREADVSVDADSGGPAVVAERVWDAVHERMGWESLPR
jgi:shikimate kinase